MSNNQPQSVKFDAHAPYNFVSLPSKVIYPDSVLDLKFNKKDEVVECDGLSKFSGNSGEIELTITTKSPLFIGDSGKSKAGELNDFFNVDGEYKIPGSSIRGMVRTLVEICSYSKFSFFNDHKFYFRDVAGKSKNSLKKYYEEIMVGRKNITDKYGKSKTLNVSKSKAGFLQKIDEREYIIIPTSYKREKFNKAGYSSYNPPAMIARPKKDENNKFYYELFSGKMQGKKHFYIFEIPRSSKNSISLKYADIKNYNEDNLRQPQRDKFLDLVKKLDEKLKSGKAMYPYGIPCFYTEYKGKIYFGHTPYFRIPYQNSIGDIIDKNLKDDERLDLTEAIFGKDKVLATRVFFEDASLKNEPKWLTKNDVEIILSSPKPTSYNLYLEQGGVKNVSEIKHYDSNSAKIRGYKFYHHQDFDLNKHIEKTKQNTNENMKKHIKPLNSENIFKTKIRFESLSDIELGALLFVLNLPQNCYHKIGMAKPLGFGKIEIKANLKIYDLEKRYSILFDENSEFCEPNLENSSQNFISKFQEFILDKLGEDKKSLWEVDRLKELEIMLRDDKNGDFSYMELDDFKHKDKILPKAGELRWR